MMTTLLEKKMMNQKKLETYERMRMNGNFF